MLLTDDRERFERSIYDNYPEASKESVDKPIDLALRVENELSAAEPMSVDLTSIPVRAMKMIPLLFTMRTVLKYARLPANKFLEELFPGDELMSLRTAL